MKPDSSFLAVKGAFARMSFKLEAWKFMVYLVVPIGAVYIFSVPDIYKSVITNKKYIVYRPQAFWSDDDEAGEKPGEGAQATSDSAAANAGAANDTSAASSELTDDVLERMGRYALVGKEHHEAAVEEYKAEARSTRSER